jgi:3-hydroxymyristoyl/3-hydroxydecanoyl-(acyl carrier protein) dehydratase
MPLAYEQMAEEMAEKASHDVAAALPSYDAEDPSEHETDLVMDREACLRFAVGGIGEVWGEAYAFIDHHPTRVRLPDEPLMLVDRVLALEGEPFSLKAGRIVTEHDILPDAWYLDAGRIPTCIAVESGQADLMLSAYLGIDRETLGLAMYRLLDAEITFHSGLPKAGEVIHHDIRIERFFRHDQTYLFRFSFDSTVRGQRVLTMRQGCAGFFSEAALLNGKGVVLNEKEWPQGKGFIDERGVAWRTMALESYDDAQLAALRRGDLVGCFGKDFSALPLSHPLTLPGERDSRMKLLDRVLSLSPQGGRFGIGCLIGEMDIHPDDWFLTCHFIDDQVMPGTLMYECCLHTMRLFLLRMGWIAEAGDAVWEPVAGVRSQLQCRGQVLASTEKVHYEIHIKQLGYNPAPFAIADALMYADGKPIVRVLDMSLQLTGSSYESLLALWKTPPHEMPQLPILYNREQILEYAIGKPSLCFGERFQCFDEDRFLARLPNPPYLFMDRVIHVEGELAKMQMGTRVIAAYDIPPDAWYFSADRQMRMPYAILLEIALQPCGWMAAFMGSALTSNEALHFRNLGGEGILHRQLTPQSGTLHIDVSCTQVAHSGGMIIQHYSLRVEDSLGAVYTGKTYFGFFTAQALAQQVGLRGIQMLIDPALDAQATEIPYPTAPPFPTAQMRMLDTLWRYPHDADPTGAILLSGFKHVDPEDWFFKAHFYQDPVWPGSLGLEAFLQLLKLAAYERWGLGQAHTAHTSSPPSPQYGSFLSMSAKEPHRWSYRGQVIPNCQRVRVDARIKEFDDTHQMLRADGLLHVDGRSIYEMRDFTMSWISN